MPCRTERIPSRFVWGVGLKEPDQNTDLYQSVKNRQKPRYRGTDGRRDGRLLFLLLSLPLLQTNRSENLKHLAQNSIWDTTLTNVVSLPVLLLQSWGWRDQEPWVMHTYKYTTSGPEPPDMLWGNRGNKKQGPNALPRSFNGILKENGGGTTTDEHSIC